MQHEHLNNHRITEMPTKFTLYKWLCDHCPVLSDTEPECHVHERDTHKHDDVHVLEQICARVQHANTQDLLVQYEQLCNAMLDKIVKLKDIVAPKVHAYCCSGLGVPCFRPYTVFFSSQTYSCPGIFPSVIKSEAAFAVPAALTHHKLERPLPVEQKIEVFDLDATVIINDGQEQTACTDQQNRPDGGGEEETVVENTKVRYTCDKCGKSYVHKRTLREHLRNTHHITKTAFKCTICAMKFVRKSGYDHHQQQEHASGTGAADDDVSRLSPVLGHDQQPHMTDDVQDGANHEVDKMPPPPSKRMRKGRDGVQENVVHGEKVHACKECNRHFGTLRNLQLHMRMHTNERPYRTGTRNAPHLPTSSQQPLRPPSPPSIQSMRGFKCSHCSMAFTQGSVLRTHTRYKHTHEKPYTCAHCDEAFYEPRRRKVHSLRVHGVE